VGSSNGYNLDSAGVDCRAASYAKKWSSGKSNPLKLVDKERV
jgi:hypothetical protein